MFPDRLKIGIDSADVFRIRQPVLGARAQMEIAPECAVKRT
jgi:hypothetical protein